MSRRLEIRPWLSDTQLLAWMQEARSREEYQRRLAIWLALLEPWPAHRIARAIGVSEPAIWKWVGQYNRQGPVGLERQGRGGRRWAFLSLDQEIALLAEAQEEASAGKILTAKHLLPKVEKALGHEVSVDYVYALLRRHQWRKIDPRPKHPKGDAMAREAFKKTPRRSSPKR